MKRAPRRPLPPRRPVVVDRPPPTCDTGNPLCGAPARLYAAGYRCDEHRPRSIRTTRTE